MTAIGRMKLAPIPGTAQLWPVEEEVVKGTALSRDGVSGVALGNSGGHKTTREIGEISITYPTPAAGYAAGEVGVETTGTYEFDSIEGVTAATEQTTPVFITDAGDLTTTETDNVLFGHVNYLKGYAKAIGKAPVKIGG